MAAFIQISNDWGTITAGHSGSFFNDWGSNTFGTRIGIDDPTTNRRCSATPMRAAAASRRLSLSKTILGRTASTSGDGRLRSYAGQEWPDLVGNAGFSGGWGSFTAMGVLHHIHVKERRTATTRMSSAGRQVPG